MEQLFTGLDRQIQFDKSDNLLNDHRVQYAKFDNLLNDH